MSTKGSFECIGVDIFQSCKQFKLIKTVYFNILQYSAKNSVYVRGEKEMGKW